MMGELQANLVHSPRLKLNFQGTHFFKSCPQCHFRFGNDLERKDCFFCALGIGRNDLGFGFIGNLADPIDPAA